MNHRPARFFVPASHRLMSTLIAFVVLILPALSNPIPSRAEPQTLMPICHVGVDTPMGVSLVDMSTIGVTSYMNWNPNAYSTVDPSIAHAKVLRVGNEKLNRYGVPCTRSTYTETLATLDFWVGRYDNASWLIGNEPDTTYSCQDDITPQQYAQRYFELANAIKTLDPEARVAFGSIVQPTPIRIRYLTYAWNELVSLAGSANAASQLIDFWNIHAFILNEDATPGSWGTGIPRGFENDHADAIIIEDLSDAHNIDIFRQRIIAFREFMKLRGEQQKPLWISEYGNLYPPLGDYGFYTVPDEVTRDYMLATFDVMLGTKIANIGYSGDNNRLVQRWFWYGLYHDRAWHGGALFYPSNGLPTVVGDGFLNYNPVGLADNVDPDITIENSETSYQFAGFANPAHTLVNYLVKVRLRNMVNADLKAPVNVKIYEGPLLVGQITGAVMRCSGVTDFLIPWNGVQPNVLHPLRIVAEIMPGGGTDIHPGDNQIDYNVTPLVPKFLFVPILKR